MPVLNPYTCLKDVVPLKRRRNTVYWAHLCQNSQINKNIFIVFYPLNLYMIFCSSLSDIKLWNKFWSIYKASYYAYYISKNMHQKFDFFFFIMGLWLYEVILWKHFFLLSIYHQIFFLNTIYAKRWHISDEIIHENFSM